MGGETRRSRLDVRVRLIGGLAAIVAVVASSRPTLPLAMFVLSVVAILLRKSTRRSALLKLLAPLAMAAVIAAVKAFATGSTPAWSFTLAGREFVATREGLASGLLLGSRVLGSVSLLLAVFSSVPPHEVFAAMRWAKAPRPLVEIALLMCRYIFALFEQAADIRAAQTVRLGYSTVRRSLASAASLAGLITLRSIDQADRTHDAMVARGYRGRMPLPALPAFGWGNAAVLAILLAVCAGALLAAERWPR
jgi:cobalt/nickel transport system permease protein